MANSTTRIYASYSAFRQQQGMHRITVWRLVCLLQVYRRACKHSIAPLLDVNSELAVTDHDKAAQFTSIFTVDDGILLQVETRTQSQLSDMNLSPEVIRKCMCKLPNKFSRSPDGIPSAVLRSLSFELCKPLYYLSRQSLDTGTCPSVWKSADITHVHKKGDA